MLNYTLIDKLTWGVREAARNSSTLRVTALLHHIEILPIANRWRPFFISGSAGLVL